MKPNQIIESLSVPRKRLAESDKVRYRVYSTPTEFIAVIAESALMAVRVSGIKTPHKIVRDLPTEGIAVEAKKMAEIETVMIPVTQAAATKRLTTEIAPPSEKYAAKFEPMGIADLQHKGVPRARILPPEMVSEIIEEHSKAVAAAHPVAVAEQEPEQVVEPPEPVAEPMTIEEKITQLADEVLPEGEPKRDANGDVILSPEEVEKLLNE